jgi:hypothetical protein
VRVFSKREKFLVEKAWNFYKVDFKEAVLRKFKMANMIQILSDLDKLSREVKMSADQAMAQVPQDKDELVRRHQVQQELERQLAICKEPTYEK